MWYMIQVLLYKEADIDDGALDEDEDEDTDTTISSVLSRVVDDDDENVVDDDEDEDEVDVDDVIDGEDDSEVVEIDTISSFQLLSKGRGYVTLKVLARQL